MFEKLFKLKENNTNIRTELMAGLATFMAMAYILAVNPSILGDAGMNKEAVLMATAISSAIGCFVMALLANYPVALAPGMGLNAVFAYTFVLGMSISWQMALLAVFCEGVIFIVMSFFNIREVIFESIPIGLKHAISAGIGLFIAFIGFKSAGIIVDDESTFVTLCTFNEDFYGAGLTALISLIGIIFIVVLEKKGVKGNILIGMLVSWGLGIFLELVGIFKPATSCLPQFTGYDFSVLSETFGKCFEADFSNIKIADFIVIIFTFLFVDMFDTVGVLAGIAAKAGLLDEKGRLPKVKSALLADAIATTTGAVLGTSTVSSYVESTVGVVEGGKTGLTSATVGALFLLAVFVSPLFIAIPSFASATALVVVGVYMVSSVKNVNFEDFSEAVPAFLAIVIMPFTYSIANGIFISIIAYTIIHLCLGKKVSPLMIVLSVLFIARYAFL